MKTTACLRPVTAPRPQPSPFPGKKNKARPGPRRIGAILAEIARSPGGFAGEARRILGRRD